MDDLDLHLALEALRTNPAAHTYHERITRGMQALEQGTLTPFERDALRRLLDRFPSTTPSPDPIAALIAAFQDKLPSVDHSALSTAIHALVAGDAAQLDGKSLALTIERRGQTQIANLAERNLVMGDLNQLDISVHIPIPDARFDHLMQAAFQRQTHERITKAAQQIESDRLLNLRLQGFVGRVTELAAIREHIETMRPTGGYILIKAAAGEGKSSSIAKMIQEAGITQTPHHFIALTTGREYQLGLLRAVVAQLILKHHLTVSYFPEESYPAMKAEFARILDELSKQGIPETIYLDGLDQLQPEIDGSRDLSFLPPQPPPGIVIVLGSRPDETLKPLEILHRVDYDLPPLNEDDALQLWRSVQPDVSDSLLHDLYRALKGNALFVHLAADTMRDQSIADATSLIKQIEQNPQNLFGITLERMKGRSRSQWDTVWKPMLALLLVAQEPLRLDVLGDLLGHDHDTMQDAVWVLGGLVSQGIDQRVALHHLLFRDYLAVSVFNQREVKRWQQRMADWCSVDLEAIWTNHGDALEQDRRMYARHHYITHLSLAENWTVLWQVLDAGDYGEQKTRFDPSTRLYALDLDRGRESAINAGQSIEEHIQNLPRLWKYSLLRTSLTSRVDQWPDEAFTVLAMIGQTHEALERIELVSDPKRQIRLWKKIISLCDSQYHHVIITRAHQVVRHILGIEKICALGMVAEITATLGKYEQAIGILDTLLEMTQSIDDQLSYIQPFRSIAQAVAILGKSEQTIGIIDTLFDMAQSIDHPWFRYEVFIAIVQTIAMLGNIDRALTITQSMDDPSQRADALSAIAKTTAIHGDIDRALIIAQSINKPSQHAYTLGSIAESAATHGDIDRALIITQSIEDPIHYTVALSAIARTAATHCNREQATRILHIAITIVQSIDNPTHLYYDLALGAIAQAVAILGDIDRALTIIESIGQSIHYIEILGTIIQTVATHYNREQTMKIHHMAIKIIQSIDDPTAHNDSLISIAEAIAIYGNVDQSITIIQSIDDPLRRYHVLNSIATTAAIRGDIGRALIIMQSIDDPIHRSYVFNSIVITNIIGSNIDLALTLIPFIAQFIDDPMYYNFTISAIAQTVATQGDIDRALTAAQSIKNSAERNFTIGSIAQTVAIQGDIGHAITILQSIDDSSYRTVFRSNIALIRLAFIDLDYTFTVHQSIQHSTRCAYILSMIIQSDKKSLGRIQKEWFSNTQAKELWIMTSIITPLIKESPWIGIAILEEETWVNDQLKRLG